LLVTVGAQQNGAGFAVALFERQRFPFPRIPGALWGAFGTAITIRRLRLRQQAVIRLIEDSQDALKFGKKPAKNVFLFYSSVEQSSSLKRNLTLEGAATELQLPRRSVLALCQGKKPKLTHARLDYRNFRFRRADLDAYLAKRTVVAR
jgi:hypothetical protein